MLVNFYRVLIYTALFTPFNIAFEDEKSFLRKYLDYGADLVFLLDIIINFVSSYFDNEDNLVVEHKKIAINYLKGWFWIDFISIIPFEFIFPDS